MRILTKDDKSSLKKLQTFLKFLLFGPFILLASIPVDTAVFFYNLYTKPSNSSETALDVPLTQADMEVFENCLDLALQEKRSNLTDEKDIKKRANTEVDFVDLNRIIQQELKVV